MKSRAIAVLVFMGVIIVMGVFGLKKNKKSEKLVYRLEWFELQIAPFSYRFSILPEQPILMGYEGENGEKGATMLIRYEHVPEIYERTVEKVAGLVKKSGILRLPPSAPGRAFADDALKVPSVHIRLAYADNTQWAGFYDLDNIPDEVSALIKDTKLLAKQSMKEQSNTIINGDDARSYLKPDKNAAQKNSPSIIVKVKIDFTGVILVNGQSVMLPELGTILDDLKQKNGEVWYYRDAPDKEPPESVSKTIEQVLDAIISRKLPIRLQTEEY